MRFQPCLLFVSNASTFNQCAVLGWFAKNILLELELILHIFHLKRVLVGFKVKEMEMKTIYNMLKGLPIWSSPAKFIYDGVRIF